MESPRLSENLNIRINPIVLQDMTTISKNSPRCMLRITDSTQGHLLQAPRLRLPSINKTKSAAVTPLPLSPGATLNKNEGFPDIPVRYGQKRESEERKTDREKDKNNIRTMRKYNSDKRLKSNNMELPPLTHAILRKSTETIEKDEGVFVFDY